MAKYRIVKYQKTIVNRRNGKEIKREEPFYIVEYKNIQTILFGKTWDKLFYNHFKSYEEAEKALMEWLNKGEEKEVITKKVISKF